MLRPLDGDVGRLHQRATRVDGTCQEERRLLDDRARRPRPGVRHQGLASGKPFFLYETPQAPHWVEVTESDGTVVRRARPGHQVRQRHRRQLRRGPGAGPRRQARLRAQPELHDRPGAGHVPEPAAGDHDGGRRVRRHHAAAVRPRRPRQHPRHLQLRQRLHVGRARAHREVRAVRAVAARAAVDPLARARRRRDQHHPPRVLHRPDADDARGGRGRAARRRPEARRRVAARRRRRGPRSTASTGRTPRTGRPAPGRWCAPRPPSTSRPTTPPARPSPSASTTTWSATPTS